MFSVNVNVILIDKMYLLNASIIVINSFFTIY